jgi:hypothetical protein
MGVSESVYSHLKYSNGPGGRRIAEQIGEKHRMGEPEREKTQYLEEIAAQWEG